MLGALVGAALGGCGSDTGTGGPDPLAGPIAFESYCDDYARMTCDIAQSCGCFAAGMYNFCLTYQKSSCHDDVEVPVQGGRQAYDPVAAGQCQAELQAEAEDCSLADATWPTACDDMLVGQVAEGGACQGSDDCVPDLDCLGDHCIALPGDGQACHPDYGCASGTYCGSDQVCHHEQAAGGPCPEGGSACGDGLYCSSASTTCQPYPGLGESCADSYSCEGDLYCSSASQTCLPYPESGQSCADSNSCADGLYCGDDLVCHPELPAGGQCTGSEQCQSGSCTTSVCEAPQPDVC